MRPVGCASMVFSVALVLTPVAFVIPLTVNAIVGCEDYMETVAPEPSAVTAPQTTEPETAESEIESNYDTLPREEGYVYRITN